MIPKFGSMIRVEKEFFLLGEQEVRELDVLRISIIESEELGG